MKWVTERRPHVDRCASAWFIRRFVDPGAEILFVAPGEPAPRGAIPFDLPSAELGHHGGKVTLDALMARYPDRYPRKDRALARLADLVRDMDLAEFRLPESRGLEILLYGLLLAEPDDRLVLLKAQPLFEGLYQYYHGDPGR
ncbi:MAG: chromate resistance protein ChrB domain-containing protein [Thermoplasmata archaeon]